MRAMNWDDWSTNLVNIECPHRHNFSPFSDSKVHGTKMRHTMSSVKYEVSLLGLDNIRTWWRNQMETFSALLALCAGNSPVTGDLPSQMAVARGFGVFFDFRLNKRWFETPSCSLWRHCNDPRIRTLGMALSIVLMLYQFAIQAAHHRC